MWSVVTVLDSAPVEGEKDHRSRVGPDLGKTENSVVDMLNLRS